MIDNEHKKHRSMLEDAKNAIPIKDVSIISKEYIKDNVALLKFSYIGKISQTESSFSYCYFECKASGEALFPGKSRYLEFENRDLYWFADDKKWYIDLVDNDDSLVKHLIEIDGLESLLKKCE